MTSELRRISRQLGNIAFNVRQGGYSQEDIAAGIEGLQEYVDSLIPQAQQHVDNLDLLHDKMIELDEQTRKLAARLGV